MRDNRNEHSPLPMVLALLSLPTVTRMKWPWMVFTWVISWTPLLANYLGPWAWHFGNLISVFFWCGIYFSKPRAQSVTIKANLAAV